MTMKPKQVKATEFQTFLDSIRRIVRSLRRYSKSTEKTLGLTTTQIFVLQKLAGSKKALSINELAEATLTHQSTVSVVVSKLVDRHLIERIASKTDSRSVELTISKEGLRLLSKSPPSMQEQLMTGFSQMNDQERRGLLVGLQSLIQNSGLQDVEPSMLLEDNES